MSVTVPQLFEAIVESAGEDIAVLFGDRTISYSVLNRRANRLARALVRRGVGPDKLVAVAIPKSDDLVVALLAVLKAGGAYIPMDPSYPNRRLRHMAEDARPVLLLRAQDVAVELGVPMSEMIIDDFDVDKVVQMERDDNLTDLCRNDVLEPRHLMYVIYTSGSTGTPKGVAVTHAGIADVVAAQSASIAPGSGDRVLQWASISFDAAFWDLTAALLSGATLVLAESHELLPGPPLHDALLRLKITHAVLPPVALSATSAEDVLIGGTLMSTGDACSSALVAKWSLGRRMFNGYGPTETTVGSSIAGPIDSTDEVTIGLPWSGNDVYVLSDRLHQVPKGETGELYLAGNGLARGYLNRPGLTATRFVPNPWGVPGSRVYRSGDNGRQRDDGQLMYSGRRDDQVKVRGFRIELGEVENRLSAYPGIDVAAVVVVGDVLAARLVAYVSTTNNSAIETDALRAYASDALPQHMIPSEITTLSSIPVTANGKIDRKALKALSESKEQCESVVIDHTSLDSVLFSVVKEVLAAPIVGPGDNFFRLGGQSILAGVLARRIRDELGVTVPLRTIFETDTLDELAAHIQSAVDKMDVVSTASSSPGSPSRTNHSRL